MVSGSGRDCEGGDKVNDWEIGYGPRGVTGPTAATVIGRARDVEIVSAVDPDLPEGCSRLICAVPLAKQDPKQAEALKLIAAAPKLLSALKGFLNLSHRLSGCSDATCAVCTDNANVIKAARAAIAEAEGK